MVLWNFICSLTGNYSYGGFQLSFDAVIQGLAYTTPPIMALLFILDDEVLKLSPHARAIRNVEDEDLRSFFYGMSSWQFILIVVASSVGEELFYRAVVQKNRDVLDPNSQPKRSNYGPSGDKFIFGCFNQLYKIDPDIFGTCRGRRHHRGSDSSLFVRNVFFLFHAEDVDTTEEVTLAYSLATSSFCAMV